MLRRRGRSGGGGGERDGGGNQDGDGGVRCVGNGCGDRCGGGSSGESFNLSVESRVLVVGFVLCSGDLGGVFCTLLLTLPGHRTWERAAVVFKCVAISREIVGDLLQRFIFCLRVHLSDSPVNRNSTHDYIVAKGRDPGVLRSRKKVHLKKRSRLQIRRLEGKGKKKGKSTNQPANEKTDAMVE